MKLSLRLARGTLLILAGVSLTAEWVAPHHYAEQFREAINEPPSWRFPLGTDGLGRDRLSRLIYGARVSLLLAPLAAGLATSLAGFIGIASSLSGPWLERLLLVSTDLWMTLPWVFLLLTARALLPLDTEPFASVTITFLLLGLLGWPATARIVAARAQQISQATYLLQARACGERRHQLWFRHVWPNLRPVLLAQFWVLVPAFILAEANLSFLGLGVSEPLPSWGSLLRDLENPGALWTQPWIAAPAVVVVIVIACLHGVLPETGGRQ